MELRNLLSFIQVAELGSFTRAAEALGYTQSTVSFQIKQLETELDCLLFERINHTVSLTDTGKELLKYAHSVNKMTEEFKQNVIAPDALRGKIHFVAPDSICEDMLQNNYLTFHRQYPHIDLKFTNADTQTMFSMLDKNEADAVMTLDDHVYQSDYVIEKEEPVVMHFVAGPASPFVGRSRLRVEELLGAPFILTEKGMGYRRGFDNELARMSLEIAPVLEVGRTDIITALLETTDMISYLPDFLIRDKVEKGSLACLDVIGFRTNTWKQLIYHKNKWISHCLHAFLAFVKEHEFGR